MSIISLSWLKLVSLCPNKKHPRHPVDGLMYFTVLELGFASNNHVLSYPCSKV